MTKEKCCICKEEFEVGYRMNEQDCICSTFSCCYEYCDIEGEKVYQFKEEDEVE